MSSYKNFNGPVPPLPNASMTGTTVLTVGPIDTQDMQSTSFQPVWTGNPTGTFKVQVSNDAISTQPSGTPAAPTNWTDLVVSITTQPAGGAGNTFIPVYAHVGRWLRLVYTNASGSGTLSCGVMSKTR